MKQLITKTIKLILSRPRLVILILLSILFLLSTQILLGQNISRTTQLQDSLIVRKGSSVVCIPSSLADTIIRDLEERKLLILQKKLFIQRDSIQSIKLDEFNTKNIELTAEISILEKQKDEWKTKARLRGWQRNGFIVGFIALAVIFVK